MCFLCNTFMCSHHIAVQFSHSYQHATCNILSNFRVIMDLTSIKKKLLLFFINFINWILTLLWKTSASLLNDHRSRINIVKNTFFYSGIILRSYACLVSAHPGIKALVGGCCACTVRLAAEASWGCCRLRGPLKARHHQMLLSNSPSACLFLWQVKSCSVPYELWGTSATFAGAEV